MDSKTEISLYRILRYKNVMHLKKHYLLKKLNLSTTKKQAVVDNHYRLLK